MRARCFAQLVVVVLFAVTACENAPAPADRASDTDHIVLERVGPDACQSSETTPTELHLAVTMLIGELLIEKDFEAICEYLTREVGIPVKLVKFDNAEALLDGLDLGQIQIASLSPLMFVRAAERQPCLQLLATQVSRGSTHYVSYLLVRRNSGIRSVEDLKGKRLALVSPHSTSGSLLPQEFFHKRGIKPADYFSSVEYTGDHIASLRKLASGEVDVAATYSEIMHPAAAAGVETAQLAILAITGRTPYDAIVAASNVPPDIARRVAQALFRLNQTTPVGASILQGNVEINGWVPTRNSLYDPLRTTLKTLRLAGVSP